MTVVREQLREEGQWLKQATAVTEETDQVRKRKRGGGGIKVCGVDRVEGRGAGGRPNQENQTGFYESREIP